MLPTIMDVATLAISAFSPSKTCRVRVSSTRYRHDPYRARVFANYSAAATSFLSAARVLPAIQPAAAKEVAPRSPVSIAPLNWAKLMATATAPTAAPSPVKPAAPTVVAAPKATAPVAAKGPHYALVGFKHEAGMYQAPFRVAVGDVVIVEADRGEHIGVVQEITTTAPKYNVPCRIVRHANPTEYELIDDLTAQEKSATTSIQKLAESLGLGIRVIDTEFQMDRNKLTVFFASKVFVDFRKLQRSLFRDYRCRIWLVNWAEVRGYSPVTVNPCA